MNKTTRRRSFVELFHMSSNETNPLFTPIMYGPFEAKNRTVLAPLTRIRADKDLCVTDLHVQYYKERTDNNLIITEATIISEQSIASNAIPGCFNEQQALAWKQVNDAIHSKGGVSSLQAWHQGRAAHSSYTAHPLAKLVNAIVCESTCATPLPSSITAPHAITGELIPHTAPKMMTVADIERYYQQLLKAADLAFNVAGFDLFEVHGAHGYLIDQSFNDGTNQMDSEEARARGDGSENYGGSFENRFRLARGALKLLCDKYPGRIAIRISPHRGTGFHAVTDSNPTELYKYVYAALAEFNLAYVLTTEERWDRTNSTEKPEEDPFYNLPLYSAQFSNELKSRTKFDTKIIGCGGFTAESARRTLELDDPPYHAVGFGRWYISNPDLVFRLQYDLPFNRYNRATFYATPYSLDGTKNPDPALRPIGYTDYPSFELLVKQILGEGVEVGTVVQDLDLVNKMVEARQDEQIALIPLSVIGTSKSSAARSDLKG